MSPSYQHGRCMGNSFTLSLVSTISIMTGYECDDDEHDHDNPVEANLRRSTRDIAGLIGLMKSSVSAAVSTFMSSSAARQAVPGQFPNGSSPALVNDQVAQSSPTLVSMPCQALGGLKATEQPLIDSSSRSPIDRRASSRENADTLDVLALHQGRRAKSCTRSASSPLPVGLMTNSQAPTGSSRADFARCMSLVRKANHKTGRPLEQLVDEPAFLFFTALLVCFLLSPCFPCFLPYAVLHIVRSCSPPTILAPRLTS